MQEHRDRLIYLAGSLYAKSQELKALMAAMADDEESQGELVLLHRNAAGEKVQLHIHIDEMAFTLMPDDSQPPFRLDITDSSIRLE